MKEKLTKAKYRMASLAIWSIFIPFGLGVLLADFAQSLRLIVILVG